MNENDTLTEPAEEPVTTGEEETTTAEGEEVEE